MTASKQQYSVTLNRAHKIADRLKGLVATASAQVRESFGVSQVVGRAGAPQLERFDERRLAGEAALLRFASLNAALQDLRAAVGRANVEAGVSDVLARQEAMKREIALLREISKAPDANAITPEQLAVYEPLGSGERSLFRSEGVAVCTLPVERRRALEAQLLARQTELFALDDRLADLNAQKVSFTLAAELGSELGLA